MVREKTITEIKDVLQYLLDAQKPQVASGMKQPCMANLLNEILRLSDIGTVSGQHEQEILLILRHNFDALPASSATLKASANIIADKIRSDGYRAQESTLDFVI